MTEKFRVLIGCQNKDCAAEVSHHLEDVRLFRDRPVCQTCHYENLGLDLSEEEHEVLAPWDSLPRVTLSNLCE